MDGLELDGLSEEEKNIILSVMRRDEELRQKQENRVSQVKQEVQDLRMKSALRNGDDLSKVCARCKAPFGFLVNSGEMCPVCRFKVCKDCRATLLNQNGWMCTLCFKENQLRWLSGKWMTDEQKATRDSDSETASTASAQDQHTTGPTKRQVQETLGVASKVAGVPEEPVANFSPSDPKNTVKTGHEAANVSSERSDVQFQAENKSESLGLAIGTAVGRDVSSCQAEKTSNTARNGSGQQDSQSQLSQKSETSSKDSKKSSQKDARHKKEASRIPITKNKLTKQNSFTGKTHKDSDSAKLSKEGNGRRGSGCSFISSEIGEKGPKKQSPSIQSSQERKEGMDSGVGLSSEYVSASTSTELAMNISRDNSKQQNTNGTFSSTKSKSSVSKIPNKFRRDAKQSTSDVQQQTRHVNGNTRVISNLPIRRQSSNTSETSAKTASPITKIRLLDLASSRALDREETDSVKSSCSAGSEDTMSLGMSCAGYQARAEASRLQKMNHYRQKHRDADHDDEERAITKPVGQQDKSSDREKEVGRLSSQEEEDAEGGGGDSAYSTAGSVTTSVHTDHHLDDTDFNDSRHTLSESVEEFNPVVEVADDSIDDVPSLPEAYAQSEQNSSEAKDVQSKGEDVTHAQAGHDNNFVLGDKQAKEERDSGIGCDEETSVNQCQELPQTEQNEAADTAVVSSSGAVVPTLEEQIAEVQKMRSPESNLSYTMQRYFLVDDNGSDTLSIISERTEPEDKGEVTDAEGTIQTDSDSDSEGTVHDDLDGHWSDDSNDVLEAGTTTPRRLSVSELDVVAAGDLQSSGTNDSKSCESQTEIIPATPENDKAEVQMSAHQSEPSIKQSPQGDLTETLSPAKCSEENPSVETDIQVVNFEHPDNKIDALTECVPEEGKLSRITLLENSSTQTEEILFISKDYEDLWRELLTHHEGGKQRLYRSYSEDWTQTDFPTEDINDTDKYQSEQDEAQKLTQNGKLEKEDSCLDIESDGQSEIQLDNRQDRPDITDHSSHISQTKESLPDTSSTDCVLSNTRAAEDPDTCEKESISVSLTSEVMVLHQENKVPIQNMDEVQADNTDDRPYLHGDSSRPTTNNEENSNVETSDLQGISRTSSPDCILPVYEENPENDEVIRTPSPDYSPDIPEVINPDAVETRTTPSPDYLPDALVDLDDLPISGETDNVLGTQPTKKGTEVEMHHPATPQLLNGTVVATSDQSDSAVETASSQEQNIAESPRGSDRRFPSSALPSSKAGSTEELDRNEEDNVDQLFAKHKRVDHLNGSRISIAGSRESLASVYSDAGEINYGRIPVTGEITFGLEYDQKASALKIHIKHCHDLAPVDTKHNRSDPYVKVYLLPDKTRSGKRKSKIKKHTLNPVYNETLSYNISSGELETRTLWVTVWHSDRFGRNDFLGEVSFPIDMEIFRDPTPQTYYLESRIPEPSTDSSLQYKGDLVLSLMYVTADKVKEDKLKSKSKSKKSKAAAEPQGEIRVMIKSAKNLTAVRSSGSSDPFVKGYLLPDRGRTRKQKTPVVKNSVNPMWNHILVFENVDPNDIAERSLELTVWDHEKLGTNEFLGGAQLNLGLGTKEGQPVDWMDAKGEEVLVWQNIIEQANTWFDAQLLLRPSMGKCSSKK